MKVVITANGVNSIKVYKKINQNNFYLYYLEFSIQKFHHRVILINVIIVKYQKIYSYKLKIYASFYQFKI